MSTCFQPFQKRIVMLLKKTDSIKTTITAFAATLALSACGGGGGSDSGNEAPQQGTLQYVGAEQAAVITTDNAEAVFNDFHRMIGPPKITHVVGSNGDIDDDTIFTFSIALRDLATLIDNLKNGAQYQPNTQNCNGGGQVRSESSNSPPRVETDFYNCTQDGVTSDGTLILTEAPQMSNNNSAQSITHTRFHFVDLTFSDPDNYFAYNGTLDCVYAGRPDAQFANIDNFNASLSGLHCRTDKLVIEDINRKTYQLINFEFADTPWNGGARNNPGFNLITLATRTYSISGRFYHPDHGYVDVSDGEGNWPMAYLDVITNLPGGYANGGVALRLTGDNSSMQLHRVYSEDVSQLPDVLLLINGDSVESAEATVQVEI
jgi:hypothetical protein